MKIKLHALIGNGNIFSSLLEMETAIALMVLVFAVVVVMKFYANIA